MFTKEKGHVIVLLIKNEVLTMRKIFLGLLAAVVCLVGCGAENTEAEVNSIATSTPISVSQHVCDNVCLTCGLCLDATCTEKACIEKCEGHNDTSKAISDDYITTEDIELNLEKAVYHIGENVYVPGNLESNTNKAMNVIEQISGLSFEVNEYPSEEFTDGKTHIFINKDLLYSGAEWYNGLDSNEFGGAYEVNGIVWAAPGDLLLGNSNTIIHELCHALMWRQSPWYHGTTLNEGFAEYTTYLVLQEMEEKYPELAVCFDESATSINNMFMSYEELYEQPIEYWFENSYEYAGNGNYAVGFRFMAYLHDVYGDYIGWIIDFEKEYPFKDRNKIDDQSTLEQRFAILKQTYGDDVLDNFYPWLKEHVNDFEEQERKIVDISDLQEINIYPEYNAIQEELVLVNIMYNNLYINLEPARKYIGEYKGMDASKLVLQMPRGLKVCLYDTNGTGKQTTTDGNSISLEGISGIKLVGEGTVERLEISGF